MNTVWEIIYARQLPLHYAAPPICEVIFSGSASPIIVLSEPAIGKVTGLVLGGFGNFRLSWNQFPGALCYNIYRLEGGTTYVIHAECVPNTFFDLVDSGTYVVTPITLEGEGPISDPIVFDSGGGGGVSTVEVEATCAQTGRNGFPAIFTITRDSVTPVNLTVNFTLGGTAVNGDDYVAIPLSATIPAGFDFVDVEIDPEEMAFAGTKTVTLTITNSLTYAVGPANSAMVVIRPSLLRIADYGTLQPLLVPAPAGGVPETAKSSDGCEWEGTWNYVETFPPVPGPEFVYYYQDVNGAKQNGLVPSVQGTKLLHAILTGPFTGFVRWQLQILGELEDGSSYIIWQGFKPQIPMDPANGTYQIAGPNFSDLRPTLEIEFV